jgi:glucose/arabinose dehydrogenase
MKHFLAFCLSLIIPGIGTNGQMIPADSIHLDKIILPEGYKIELYASGLANARQMDFSDDGTLFVGSSDAGRIYAVTDDRKVIIIDKGLEMPAGVDFFQGTLYVADVSRILKYDSILYHLETNPKPVVVNGYFPKDQGLGYKFIRVGPDNKLYIPVNSTCNVCFPDSLWHARILRMSLDGMLLEIFAEGVRSSMGFDWDPVKRDMWFTDNGKDNRNDTLPPDELNTAITFGQHFGFPYLFGAKPDEKFWPQRPYGKGFVNPRYELDAHAGAQGMRFYTGKMFGEKYRGGIFIAEHGTTGNNIRSGHRITFVPVKTGRPMGYEVFCSGWLEGDHAWGTPADVQVGPDGSLFISDDTAGCIYRIYKD